MKPPEIQSLTAEIATLRAAAHVGRVETVQQTSVVVSGFENLARLGDEVVFIESDSPDAIGEIVELTGKLVLVLLSDRPSGLRTGTRCVLRQQRGLAPDDSWVGRIVNPYGAALDGKPLMRGKTERTLTANPPLAVERRGLGERLETGLAAFNTLLPIVRGQRVGLFAGSGVGKSSLLANLAKGVKADIVVVALIGERGHEVRTFVEDTLGQEGLKRAVVVAATSDQAALTRRRCAWAAMAVAEYFRDQGAHVLLLADSVTRFAEAHRDIALAAGEVATPNGFPPSMPALISNLAERAGPGRHGQGDITAIFSVLVAASDMEGPIADTLRGVLDGHIVLERQIAERGRYPAIDFLKSVSRSLPHAVTAYESEIVSQVKHLIAKYEASEMMVQAGLYSAGSDYQIDLAIAAWPKIESFLSRMGQDSIQSSFEALEACVQDGRMEPQLGIYNDI